jgi:hypothetical protein
MLEPGQVAALEAAIGELQQLIWLRLEERGALSAREGRPRLEELLRRPLGVGEDSVQSIERLSETGPLAQLVETYSLSAMEAFTVLAALAPEIDEKFDSLYDALTDRPGGRGLTGEALRNLFGRSFAARLAVPSLLSSGAKLRGLRMVLLEGGDGSPLEARVRLNPELAAWLCGRRADDPEFSSGFPATRLRTVHRLDDLVVPLGVRERLVAVLDRIAMREQVLAEWALAAHHDNASGFHILFHGPPGTGKTMAAAVLGAECGRPVYRIDLSLVVSKYIGETEKNLARVFERAEARDWILFFDEADALFGRRGEVGDARDRYANQEVSYLLQRIETFTGVTILATNFLRNVDDAFLRRTHVQVPFPAPEARERAALWRAVLPGSVPVAEDVDADELGEQFILTGAEIRNAAFHAAFRAAADGGTVTLGHLREGIRGEYEKGGRMFSAAPASG